MILIIVAMALASCEHRKSYAQFLKRKGRKMIKDVIWRWLKIVWMDQLSLHHLFIRGTSDWVAHLMEPYDKLFNLKVHVIWKQPYGLIICYFIWKYL
jgi:hypothetical protein